MLSQFLTATLLATLVGAVAPASPGTAATRTTGETIQTEVHDRVGRRLAGICVFATPYPVFEFPDFCPVRSDPNGAVSVPVPGPGTYNLFALPDSGSRYGAQWVGRDGGTGTQKQARRITVTAGETKRVVVGPLGNGTVGIVGPDPDGRRDPRYSPLATDGLFTIDWLGPYSWPLVFQADGYAYQWSGGVGNRLLAELVPAAVEPTSTYWYPLLRGAWVTVVIPDHPGPGRLVIRNAATQDPVALIDHHDWAEGKQFRLLSGQQVKLQCLCGPTDRWHGGTDFASATPEVVRDNGWSELTFLSAP
jgi:hypothetical protein